jgi:uncharacterized membrane protein
MSRIAGIILIFLCTTAAWVVLGATIMVTVPINKELEAQPATDYPSDRSQSLVKNWSRAHAVRTTLGIGAFVCAVAASNLGSRHAK